MGQYAQIVIGTKTTANASNHCESKGGRWGRSRVGCAVLTERAASRVALASRCFFLFRLDTSYTLGDVSAYFVPVGGTH